MKHILLLSLLLMACINNGNEDPEKRDYQFEGFSGMTWEHKNDAVVDSFPLPDTLKAYYLRHVDIGFYQKLKISVAGDSFSATTEIESDGRLVDTTIKGPVDRRGPDFLNLIKELPCDSAIGSGKSPNFCFRREDGKLIINICFDLLFDDPDFSSKSLDPDSLWDYNNIPGMKCGERGFSWPDMYRSELVFTFREK